MRRAVILATVIMLTACSSGGLGDISDIILGSPSTSQPSDVRGTIEYIDTGARRIDLNVSYINNLRDEQRGSIYYDDRTRVIYQNKEYRVTDLERGDQVEVRGANVSGRYVAETITVVRDVS